MRKARMHKEHCAEFIRELESKGVELRVIDSESIDHPLSPFIDDMRSLRDREVSLDDIFNSYEEDRNPFPSSRYRIEGECMVDIFDVYHDLDEFPVFIISLLDVYDDRSQSYCEPILVKSSSLDILKRLCVNILVKNRMHSMRSMFSEYPDVAYEAMQESLSMNDAFSAYMVSNKIKEIMEPVNVVEKQKPRNAF